MKLTASALLSVVLSLVSAQGNPKEVGNCVTGKINFNPNRILNNQANSSVIDEKRFDMTIDYGASNVLIGPDGLKVFLTKKADGTVAQGTRLSTTRYMLYGKFSVEMSALPVPGVVVTFITMSDRKDEIDWEFTGQHGNQVHSNVFYKGIPEYAIHNILLPVPRGIGNMHIYTLDWKRDTLTWLVDGIPARTLFRANSTSPMTPPGERWYPSTPSQIQISVWDGGSSENKGTSVWAGGPINWGNSTSFYASYKSIDIQCYDDKDMPVRSWPTQPEGVSIDFPAANGTVNGTVVNVIDKTGKVRSMNGGSSITGITVGTLFLLWVFFFQ